MNRTWPPRAEHRPWKQWLCGAFVLLVLLARVPHLWLEGEFVAEDGWVFFADAWNLPWLDALTKPYAGYQHLVPRLVAALWSGCPIVWQPYAYAFTGLVINAAILSSFYLPAFRGVVASDSSRLAIVLLLACAPNAECLGLILGLHWYLAFALTLLLIAQIPSGHAARIALLWLTFLAVWSSPSVLAIAPFAWLAWQRGRGRAERMQHAVLLGLLLVSGVLAMWQSTVAPERTGDFHAMDIVWALDRLVLRGWLGVGLLGPKIAGMLAATHAWVLDLFGAMILAGVAGLLWKTRKETTTRQVSVLLGAGLLMLLLSLTRTAYLAEMAGLTLPRHVRYLTAPTLLLYTSIGILASQTRPGINPRRIASALTILVMLLVYSLPGQLHWSRSHQWFHLRDSLPAIERLKSGYARDRQPASLYIPADVPYWGPVLEVGGGHLVAPESGLVRAINATPRPDGHFDSWLGGFVATSPDRWIVHDAWGRLEFRGVEKGRVFFRDSAGRLLFTSELLYPRAWVLDGAQWTLLQPAQGPAPTGSPR